MADLGAIGTELAAGFSLGVAALVSTVRPTQLVIMSNPIADVVPTQVGTYKIYGTITEGVTPVSCPVLLYRSGDTSVIYRGMMSGADGSYLFDNIPSGEYLVITRDPDEVWNAVCRDYVVAESMTP